MKCRGLRDGNYLKINSVCFLFPIGNSFFFGNREFLIVFFPKYVMLLTSLLALDLCVQGFSFTIVFRIKLK